MGSFKNHGLAQPSATTFFEHNSVSDVHTILTKWLNQKETIWIQVEHLGDFGKNFSKGSMVECKEVHFEVFSDSLVLIILYSRGFGKKEWSNEIIRYDILQNHSTSLFSFPHETVGDLYLFYFSGNSDMFLESFSIKKKKENFLSMVKTVA